MCPLYFKLIKFEKKDFFLVRMIVPSVCQYTYYYVGIAISEKTVIWILRDKLKKFSKCSYDVKCYLLTSYCSNLHCVSLWYDNTETAMRKLIQTVVCSHA